MKAWSIKIEKKRNSSQNKGIATPSSVVRDYPHSPKNGIDEYFWVTFPILTQIDAKSRLEFYLFGVEFCFNKCCLTPKGKHICLTIVWGSQNPYDLWLISLVCRSSTKLTTHFSVFGEMTLPGDRVKSDASYGILHVRLN